MDPGRELGFSILQSPSAWKPVLDWLVNSLGYYENGLFIADILRQSLLRIHAKVKHNPNQAGPVVRKPINLIQD